MKRLALILICCSAFSLFAFAKEAAPSSADPALEARLMRLSKELRCLVCQNETLADSQADLAQDLRNQIRDQMKAGKTDKEVVDWLTQRYGKFILYNPPFDPTTYLLWFGPFLLLPIGLFVLFRYLRQRRELIVEQPLTAAEHLCAEALLQADQPNKTA